MNDSQIPLVKHVKPGDVFCSAADLLFSVAEGELVLIIAKEKNRQLWFMTKSGVVSVCASEGNSMRFMGFRPMTQP